MTTDVHIPPGTLLGHPKGLFLLFVTEMWERFSYYGMRALLVLYAVAATHAANPGLGWGDAQALKLYAWYTGLTYFTPLFGGWLADNYIGQRRAVIIGGILMALAQFSLAAPLDTLGMSGAWSASPLGIAFPETRTSFYVGLLLLILGNGFFKPNISTMVGDLPGSKTMKIGKSAGGSLAVKILLPILIALVAGLTLSTWITVSNSSSTVGELSNDLGVEVASSAADKVGNVIAGAFASARATAANSIGQIEGQAASRASVLASLRKLLADNPNLLATWVAFEPNAFDGKDAEFVDKEGHDATGRFIPYVARDGEGSSLTALTDYDKLGLGDYYLLAGHSGQEQFLEHAHLNFEGNTLSPGPLQRTSSNGSRFRPFRMPGNRSSSRPGNAPNAWL